MKHGPQLVQVAPGLPIRVKPSNWTPMNLGSSLLAWWDASQGVTLVVSAVSAWADRKNGLSAVQAVSASRPVWSATGFNGRPGLFFDGADDYLRTVGVGVLPVGSAPAETWVVAQQGATDTGLHIALSYGGNTGQTVRYTAAVSNKKAFALAGNGTSSDSVASAGPDLTSRHLIRSRITSTAIFVSADGGSEATTAASPTTGSDYATIGASLSSTFLWTGWISDIIVTSPLSAGQAAQLQTFLMARRML